MNVLGIDIGGSGIKGAPVDTKTGELTAERHRIPTPQPATPKAIAEVVSEIVDHFEWSGPVGITFPGVVVDGEIRTAANVDKSWIGVDAQKLFGKKLKSVMVINDADAAGLAEMAFGAGKNNQGVVLVLTIGTGIGSALFMGGRLVPNTEFGHLELKGKEAESRASDAARDKRDMSWDKYAKRIGQYLRHMEMLFSPALMVLGGGISKKSDKYLPMIDLRTPVVPAKLLNEAGIVGAALAADTMALPSARATTTPRRTSRTATSTRSRTGRATTGATRSASRRSAATTPNRSSSRTSTTTGTRKAATSGTSRSTSGRSATTARATTGRSTSGTSRTPSARSTTGTSRTSASKSTGTSRTGTSRTGTGRSTGTTRAGGSTNSSARRTTRSAGGTTRRAATPTRRSSGGSRRMQG
ncbi:polyphosphate--glucose phosphotransferase [Herbidospora cretacea]|uniref:polyphosphate--glucose phosphotransferase n=1 Tax=Herbidospora cretacea TaxID=28444 RepID=UPI0007C6F18E